MRDGSTLCYYLNKHQFHFLLHGHKHSPYMCRVQYEGDGALHVTWIMHTITLPSAGPARLMPLVCE